jgi:hypothetical protein
MKLAAYYREKGEIVVFAPEFLPERHQKFIYRKDYDDGDFPLNLTKYPNVEYGGFAFSNNIYHPLPLEIERMRPDASIYAKAEERIMATGAAERRKIFQNMVEAEHCRLSLDGKTIWEEYPRQFRFLPTARNLMIHDYDLGQIPGSFEEVKKILSRARTDGWATKLGMKFPVVISNGQDLLNWSSLNSNSTFYSLRYEGVIDDEPFNEWIGTCRQRAVYSQMDYYVTPSWYDPNDFVTNLLPKILRQVIISRSYYLFFTLKYDEDFFPDKRWCQVIQLFNFYHNSFASQPRASYFKMINDDTVFDFAAASDKIPRHWYARAMSKDEIREVFAFVREENYELFKDFYECTARKLGGRL